MPELKTCSNFNEVLENLSKGSLVLTPNNRLSEVILKRFVDKNPSKSAVKPLCMPWSQWLKLRLSKLNVHSKQPLLLSEHAIRLIWNQVINQHCSWNKSAGLLSQLISASEVCLQWNIDVSHPSFLKNEQTRLFQKLWQQVELTIKSHDAITIHHIPKRLAQDQGESIIWACFDDLTPAQKLIQSCYLKQGFAQTMFDWPEQDTPISVIKANNEQEELTAAIDWLKQQDYDDGKRYALVIPDLQDCASQVQRALNKNLPSNLYDMSLGKSLSLWPLVNHALIFLKITQLEQWTENSEIWLHSPFLPTNTTEEVKRWQLLERCRYEPHRLNDGLKSNCPLLYDVLTNLSSYPKKATFSQWRHHFYQRLVKLNFAEHTALDSNSWQVLQRFYDVLDDLKQLDMVSAEVNHKEAMVVFEDILRLTIFQAKQPTAPIQICGLLEASGQPYDKIWLMHTHDQLLPAKVRLNPFIPSELQQEQGMPHSLPTREYQLAEGWLNRFKATCHALILSYAPLSANGPRLPSPLIYGLDWQEPSLKEQPPPIETMLVEESWQIPPKAQTRLRGGSYLLADQAKCPFKALTAHRLMPKRLDTDEPGISAIAKGTMLHRCMEHIWKELKNYDTLIKQSDEQLLSLISNAVDSTLEHQQQELGLPEIHPLLHVERTRMIKLVSQALLWEKQRTPFSVEALERRHKIMLSELEIHVQVDRLDVLEDGQKWVLDYKSNINNANQPWKEERPLEPQLLLYALLDNDINAMAWIVLKSGHVKAKGFSEDKEPILSSKGIDKDTSWMALRALWQSRLEVLANEIKSGVCTPTPAKADVCTYCQFKSFCRIDATD